MTHIVLWYCIICFAILLSSVILTAATARTAARRGLPAPDPAFMAFAGLMCLSLLIYCFQYISYVYMQSSGNSIDVIVYLFNILVNCVAAYFLPIALLHMHGRESERAAKYWSASASVFVLLLELTALATPNPFLRRIMSTSHLILEAGYAGVALLMKPAVRQDTAACRRHERWYAVLAATYVLVIIDAVAVNFSISKTRNIPDGILLYPLVGVIIAYHGFKISSGPRVETVHEAEIPASMLHQFMITKRELEVMKLLMRGYTNGKISEQLYISVRTVDTHVANIYKKCNVRNRVELVNLINSA